MMSYSQADCPFLNEILITSFRWSELHLGPVRLLANFPPRLDGSVAASLTAVLYFAQVDAHGKEREHGYSYVQRQKRAKGERRSMPDHADSLDLYHPGCIMRVGRAQD
jgi:hypothetical protein